MNNSLENPTMEKRGSSTTRKVNPQAPPAPTNWQGLFRNSKNKIELFDFLTKTVFEYNVGNHKVYIAKQNTV